MEESQLLVVAGFALVLLGMLARISGIQNGGTIIELTTPTAGGINWLVAPLPEDYYLSTGYNVRFIISTANLGDHLFQVMGVEDDA